MKNSLILYEKNPLEKLNHGKVREEIPPFSKGIPENTHRIEGEVLTLKDKICITMKQMVEHYCSYNIRSHIYFDYNQNKFMFLDPKISQYREIRNYSEVSGPTKFLEYGFILRKDNFLQDCSDFFLKIMTEVNKEAYMEMIRSDSQKNSMAIEIKIKIYYSPERTDRAEWLSDLPENDTINKYQTLFLQEKENINKDLEQNKEWLILKKISVQYTFFLRKINRLIYNKKVSPNILKEEKSNIEFYINQFFHAVSLILGNTLRTDVTFYHWALNKPPRKALSLAHWSRSQPLSEEISIKKSRINSASSLYFLSPEHASEAEKYLKYFREISKNKKEEKKRKKPKVREEEENE